jgi:hypothetical protein
LAVACAKEQEYSDVARQRAGPAAHPLR